MAKHSTTRGEQASTTQTQAVQSAHPQNIEIANALPMRLHALDLARHSTIAPNGKRYVVSTFDDRHVGNGYVTAVYPQQYDYLTLISLELARFSSATPEEALQRHASTLQAIQQGKLAGLNGGV
jgi:hypothetical protein